jgi:hypothetical protein
VISLAAFAWLHLSGAGSSRAAPLIGASFWPLLLYLPTNMQEPTHFALAFLFALAIDRLRRRPGASTYAWAAALLVVAALIRPTWALMILPLGWRRARDAGPWAVTGLLVVTLAIAAVAWGTFGVLASPFQNSMQQLVAAWREAPERAPETILNKTTLNLRLWFTTTEDEPPEIIFRYFIALFIAMLVVQWAFSWRRTRAPAETLEVCTLIVGPVLVIVICFGQVESWRDFRLLAPHVLAALLVAADVGWARWLWAATLVFLPLYYQEFVEFHEERFTSNPSSIAAMRDATAAAAPFVPGGSPWRNTVIAPIGLVQFPLLGLPRGMGISYVIDWSDMSRVQSAYVLLGPEDREEAAALVRLVPIAETPLGTLYRNADAVIDPDAKGR